jgi:hypothetical protein
MNEVVSEMPFKMKSWDNIIVIRVVVHEHGQKYWEDVNDLEFMSNLGI